MLRTPARHSHAEALAAARTRMESICICQWFKVLQAIFIAISVPGDCPHPGSATQHGNAARRTCSGSILSSLLLYCSLRLCLRLVQAQQHREVLLHGGTSLCDGGAHVGKFATSELHATPAGTALTSLAITRLPCRFSLAACTYTNCTTAKPA
jgi:hypothetical protein